MSIDKLLFKSLIFHASYTSSPVLKSKILSPKNRNSYMEENFNMTFINTSK